MLKNSQTASAAGMERSEGVAGGHEVDHAGLVGHSKDAGFSFETRSHRREPSRRVTCSDRPFNRMAQTAVWKADWVGDGRGRKGDRIWDG